jgi:hypothetical protein
LRQRYRRLLDTTSRVVGHPAQFEIVCYSDTPEEDDLTAHLRKSAGKWRRTFELSDKELAETVRKDRIDILVDLVGHMKGHRLCMFALKPAPVQVTAWGEHWHRAESDRLSARRAGAGSDIGAAIAGGASRRPSELPRILVAAGLAGAGAAAGDRT